MAKIENVKTITIVVTIKQSCINFIILSNPYDYFVIIGITTESNETLKFILGPRLASPPFALI